MADSNALPVRKRRRTAVATVVDDAESDAESAMPVDDSDSDMDEFKFMWVFPSIISHTPFKYNAYSS